MIVWEVINKFDSIPPSLDIVTGYDIVYTPDLEQAPVVVKQVTGANTFSTKITNPADGYYFVEAKDANSYRYPSIPHLHQGTDTIPPSPPANLSGVLNNQGHVELKWNKNTDLDLEGYKVFFSYGPKGPFSQITKTHLVENNYISELGTTFANDSIYYQVCAIDKRYNMSKPSQTITLRLPDLIGPSRPVLRQLIPQQGGIRIGWALSQDADVTRHVLQRKVKEATAWNDILEILPKDVYPPLPKVSAEVNPSNYIDTDSLDIRFYNYRLVAYDKDGNYSVSDVYEARPYDGGYRGKITRLDALIVGRGATYNPTGLSAQGNGITQTGLNNTEIGTNHLGTVTGSYVSDGYTVRLNWDYATLRPGSLRDFSIYQKIVIPPGNHPSNVPEPPFVLLKKVSFREGQKISAINNLPGYTWYVEGVKPYKYQDTNPNNIGANQGTVTFLSPIIYKIVANHTDGGFSREFTVSIQ